MESQSTDEPTIEELVTKALGANVIDEEFAEELRGSEDLEEALGMFYTHTFEQGDNPEALLRGWDIIEQGNRPMTNRLLFKGELISYAELMDQLKEGEVLVATWLRDPANFPNARPVVDENDMLDIAGKTKYGYYVKLRWFASTTGSEDPLDYGMFG
jgi:hypothetical protein